MKEWYQNNTFLNKLIGGAFFVAIAQSVFYILFLNTWWDEAGYLYKGWLAVKHGWMPYRDMAFRFPPVFYYVQGFFQYLSGPSFYIGRGVSAVFFILLLVVIYKLSSKLGGKVAGVVSLWFIVSNTFLVQYYSSATPYSLTALFVVSSLLFLTPLSDERISKKRIILSVFFMTLAVLTRQNMAPALVVLLLYILLSEGLWSFVLGSVASGLFSLFVMFPFLKNNFWEVANVVLLRSMGLSRHIPQTLVEKVIVIGKTVQKTSLFLMSFTGVIFTYFWGRSWGEIKELVRKDRALFLIATLFVVLFSFHLFFPGLSVYTVYALYSVPLVVVLIGVAMAKALNRSDQAPFLKKTISSFLFVVIIFSLVSTNVFSTSSSPFAFADSDLQRVKRGGEFVEQNTSPDDLIFTVGNPHSIFAGERIIFSPLMGSTFRYTLSEDRELAEKYHYYNNEMVKQWVWEDADVVILQKGQLSNLFSFDGGQEAIEIVNSGLKEKYDFVSSIEGVYPRKSTLGKGVMEIYRRK